jgi:hypothetical protein
VGVWWHVSNTKLLTHKSISVRWHVNYYIYGNLSGVFCVFGDRLFWQVVVSIDTTNYCAPKDTFQCFPPNFMTHGSQTSLLLADLGFISHYQYRVSQNLLRGRHTNDFYCIHAVLHCKLCVKLQSGCVMFYFVLHAQLFFRSQFAPHREQSHYVIQRKAGQNGSRRVAHLLTQELNMDIKLSLVFLS